ncbi:MAG: ABC transporter substrate-binding protein [Candidatus Limnocylindrus sp.]
MRRLPSARRGLIRKIVAALLAVSALVAGAAQLGIVSAQIPGIGVPGGELPSGEGVLSVGVVGIPSTPLPLFAETAADRAVVALTYRGLTRLDASGWPGPDLASSWSVAGDGLSWTISLDPSARWQDGTPVTAADVLSTIDLASELGTAGGYWQSITAEEGDVPGTVKLSASRALANLPTMLGSLPLLSASQFAGLSAAQIPDSAAAKTPQGTGPYRITSISSGGAGLVRRTDLLATDRTSLAEAGTSAERIALYFFPDAATALRGWSTSSIDQLVGLDIADARRGSAARGGTIELGSTVFSGIATNLRPGSVLRDPRLRAGLVALLDPSAITTVFGGSIARTPVSPLSWGWTELPDAKSGVEYATGLFKSVKWKLGDSGWSLPSGAAASLEILTLPALAHPVDAAVAAQAAAAWTAFGIPTRVTELSPVDLTSRLASGTFQLAVLNVDVGIDVDLYPLLGSGAVLTGGNISGIQLKELDLLLNRARQPGDRAARTAALVALQKWLAETNYILPIRFRAVELLTSNRVTQVTPMLVDEPESYLRAVLSFRLATP